MTLTNPSHNWEEEEVENPVGSTAWIFNSLTNELTVHRTVETADGGKAPWNVLWKDIKSAVLVDGVTTIHERAFERCIGLTLVVIPDSVVTVGNTAFGKCSFTSIKIPRSVTSFGGNPFAECENLNIIDVSENQNLILVSGVLMDKEMIKIIYCNPSKSGDYSIPNTVTAIYAGAFAGCDRLRSITIPSSVVSIGSRAFHHCKQLSSIEVPNSVKEIGEGAFALCYELESITIPGSVETLGANLFTECSKLSEIVVFGEGENLKEVDGVMFSGDMARLIWCSRRKSGSYEIPHTVKTIDEDAFYNCKKLTSITIQTPSQK